METCPHCDAPLKPAARFCLACRRPIDETSRLSVGEATVVSKGRPLVGLVVIAVLVLGLAGAAYGALTFVHHQSHHSSALVVDDVERGTKLLVAAEGGQDATACRKATTVLAGSVKSVESKCATIVGADPGATVKAIKVDKLNLQGLKGTAHVHATVSDAKGTHTIDRVVDLVRRHKIWRLSWDGHREL